MFVTTGYSEWLGFLLFGGFLFLVGTGGLYLQPAHHHEIAYFNLGLGSFFLVMAEFLLIGMIQNRGPLASETE